MLAGLHGGLAGCYLTGRSKKKLRAGRHFTDRREHHQDVLAPAIFDNYVICNGDPQQSMEGAHYRIFGRQGLVQSEIDLCNTALEVVRKVPAFPKKSFFCLGNKKKDFLFLIFFFSFNQQCHFRLTSRGAKQKYLIMLLFNASNNIYYQI